MKYSRLCLFGLFFTTLSHAQFILEKQSEFLKYNNSEMKVNVADLCTVATHTQNYMKSFPEDKFAVHQGEAVFSGIKLSQVKNTLSAVCQLTEKEMSLTELTKRFDFYRWYPDKKQADKLAQKSTNKIKTKLLTNIPDDQIFITKYYTKLLTASAVKTPHFNQALYGLPFDEQGLSLAEADKKKAELVRFKYTRQQIVAGALAENKLAPPLIWLTEEALHDVLLQGTGVVEVNGKRRYFNVHRNNDIAYDYTIGKREQKRYWYFAEVPSILGYGKTLESKIKIISDVTFAGNVKQLGLGKLFLINYQVNDKQINQLGVLADQGGAFDENLFQLDLLKGSYYGWQDYYQDNKHLPDYAKTWLMIVKE